MLDLTYAFTRQPSRVWPRRNSRPELPGWLFKEGADEEDESGSEYVGECGCTVWYVGECGCTARSSLPPVCRWTTSGATAWQRAPARRRPLLIADTRVPPEVGRSRWAGGANRPRFAFASAELQHPSKRSKRVGNSSDVGPSRTLTTLPNFCVHVECRSRRSC